MYTIMKRLCDNYMCVHCVHQMCSMYLINKTFHHLYTLASVVARRRIQTATQIRLFCKENTELRIRYVYKSKLNNGINRELAVV